MIEKFNLKTIGRESATEETRLYSKKDYEARKNQGETSDSNDQALVHDMGRIIVEALGGKENIVSVDNCYTRLRTVVKDSSLVDESTLTNATNANGVVIKDENVHVVYGLNVTKMRNAVDEFLATY